MLYEYEDATVTDQAQRSELRNMTELNQRRTTRLSKWSSEQIWADLIESMNWHAFSHAWRNDSPECSQSQCRRAEWDGRSEKNEAHDSVGDCWTTNDAMIVIPSEASRKTNGFQEKASFHCPDCSSCHQVHAFCWSTTKWRNQWK